MTNAPDWLPTILAQAKPSNPTPALIWAGILIVCAMVGGVVVMYLRRKMLEQQRGTNSSASLMETLRDMHARGEISTDEYEQTRRSIASRVSVMLDTERSDGLFELPDPKRRIAGVRPAARGPIAPPRAAPAPPPGTPPVPDLPPGYDDPGASNAGSANPGGRP
ncbi:MAG TPA: SHOCT domain-containing protein [Phycisphaerales bacterium]|nr:SHOCT domain-containing protein [Phycisphaerales bacterium]